MNHYSQSQQCSRCLRTAENGCLGFGNGRVCEENKGQRAKLSDYMYMLKNTIGYCSLKELYTKEMSRMYDNFDGDIRMTSDEDIDHYIEENLDNLESEIPMITVSDVGDGRKDIEKEKVIKTKDEEINNLTKEVESLKEEKSLSVKERIAEVEKLKETDQKLSEELNNKQRETEKVTKKLSQGRIIAEEKLLDLILERSQNYEILESTTHLYVSLFEEDNFTMDEDRVLRVNKGTFLERLEGKKLDEKQLKTLEAVQKYMKESFESQVSVRSRRVSVSIKRMKPEEFENSDKNNAQRARKEANSSVSNSQ